MYVKYILSNCTIRHMVLYEIMAILLSKKTDVLIEES